MTENYLSNKNLLKYLADSKKLGKCNDDLAKAFLLIAERMGRRSNFVGYSYRDIMESEGIILMWKAWSKFNSEKNQNAFGYFSVICWRGFLVIMKREKKQHRVRDEICSKFGLTTSYKFQEGGYE